MQQHEKPGRVQRVQIGSRVHVHQLRAQWSQCKGHTLRGRTQVARRAERLCLLCTVAEIGGGRQERLRLSGDRRCDGRCDGRRDGPALAHPFSAIGIALQVFLDRLSKLRL